MNGFYFIQGEGSEDGSLCWSTWIDRDDPSGTGDWEVRSSIIKENYVLCDEPTEIECQTSGGTTDFEYHSTVRLRAIVPLLVCRN